MNDGDMCTNGTSARKHARSFDPRWRAPPRRPGDARGQEFSKTIKQIIPRKADKADRWCSLLPSGGVVLGTKGQTYFSDWVIRGSGKLHCVRFITLRWCPVLPNPPKH